MTGIGSSSTSEETTGTERPAPIFVSRQRLLERAGRPGPAVQTVAALVGATLIATAIFRDLWALLPLASLVVAMALGPLAIRHDVRPERSDLIGSLILTIAMAVAAGLTGGVSSPIVFLFPIGVVMQALRAAPRPVVLCSLITLVVFIVVTVLHDPGSDGASLLDLAAIAVMQVTVTIASVVVVNAEISHRGTSIVDPLTGLLNRQGLPDRFEELRQQARVAGAPITLVMFDLDLFKAVNDAHGHAVGDQLLQEVADVVRRTLRTFEPVYRIGGEEFLILLPGMTEWEGANVAEQLRLAISTAPLATQVGITASFGVSGADSAEIDFEQLHGRADQALYQAKRGGRDRVTVSGAPAPTP